MCLPVRVLKFLLCKAAQAASVGLCAAAGGIAACDVHASASPQMRVTGKFGLTQGEVAMACPIRVAARSMLPCNHGRA